MCQFCVQHGEGRKWYLAMRNYSRELVEQRGRAGFIDDVVAHFEETAALYAALDATSGVPLAGRLVRRMVGRMQKAYHWGQIVPIEDVDEILELQECIVRFPCACRRLTTGREARMCFGLGTYLAGVLREYPDYSLGLEVLEKEEARQALRSLDGMGMVHSVWTFKTPYIGALCNCDQDCLAYRLQVKAGLMQIMFRSEYVAVVNWDLCNGCRQCALLCQFGAVSYSSGAEKVTIDMRQCYGCGVCRAGCDRRAITLEPRNRFVGLPW